MSHLSVLTFYLPPQKSLLRITFPTPLYIVIATSQKILENTSRQDGPAVPVLLLQHHLQTARACGACGLPAIQHVVMVVPMQRQQRVTVVWGSTFNFENEHKNRVFCCCWFFRVFLCGHDNYVRRGSKFAMRRSDFCGGDAES